MTAGFTPSNAELRAAEERAHTGTTEPVPGVSASLANYELATDWLVTVEACFGREDDPGVVVLTVLQVPADARSAADHIKNPLHNLLEFDSIEEAISYAVKAGLLRERSQWAGS